jgi:hypothetical protein
LNFTPVFEERVQFPSALNANNVGLNPSFSTSSDVEGMCLEWFDAGGGPNLIASLEPMFSLVVPSHH